MAAHNRQAWSQPVAVPALRARLPAKCKRPPRTQSGPPVALQLGAVRRGPLHGPLAGLEAVALDELAIKERLCLAAVVAVRPQLAVHGREPLLQGPHLLAGLWLARRWREPMRGIPRVVGHAVDRIGTLYAAVGRVAGGSPRG